MPVGIIKPNEQKVKKLTMWKEADIFASCQTMGKKTGLPISGGIFTMGPGRMDVVYGWDEIGYHIAGECEIEVVDTGEKAVATAGDILYASKGTHVILTVKSTSTAFWVSFPHWEEATKGTPMEGFFDEE